jgi:maltooligosyltrehalose trehalohydrolase
MLFMGEEWGAGTPWQFFTSHPEPALAAAVATGRRAEFTAHGWADSEVPDPQDGETFARSKLDWAELEKPQHREMFDLYRQLIALRKSRAELSDPRLDRVDVRHTSHSLVVYRGDCAVAVNLAERAQRISLPRLPRAVLLVTQPGVMLTRNTIELPPETAAIVSFR